MGMMADLLNAMVITVSSPDGQVRAEQRNRDDITISFGGTYGHYSEQVLAPQLSALVVRLWTAFDKGHEQALAQATRLRVVRHREDPDAAARRYKAEAAETTAEGISPQYLVYMTTTGRRGCDVVIRDGALRRLDEEQFVAELLSAYRAMEREYSGKLFQLRNKHFGRFPGSQRRD